MSRQFSPAAAFISAACDEVTKARYDIARVGRYWRDVLGAEVQSLAAAAATSPTADEVTEPELFAQQAAAQASAIAQLSNYRGSRHSAAEWAELALGIWRVYTVCDDEPPTVPGTGPTTTPMNIQVICMKWADAGTTGGEFNQSVQRLAITMSRLPFILKRAVDAYTTRCQSIVEALGDDATCPTGRTKAQWQNAIAALTDVYNVCLTDVSVVTHGRGAQIAAFG